MRVICTMLLARGTRESLEKSLEYVEAAAELIKYSNSSSLSADNVLHPRHTV